jgi:hypothetical protein
MIWRDASRVSRRLTPKPSYVPVIKVLVVCVRKQYVAPRSTLRAVPLRSKPMHIFGAALFGNALLWSRAKSAPSPADVSGLGLSSRCRLVGGMRPVDAPHVRRLRIIISPQSHSFHNSIEYRILSIDRTSLFQRCPSRRDHTRCAARNSPSMRAWSLITNVAGRTGSAQMLPTWKCSKV